MAFRPSTPFGMTGQGRPNDGFSIPDREFFQKAMPAETASLGDDLILNNDFNLPQNTAFVKSDLLDSPRLSFPSKGRDNHSFYLTKPSYPSNLFMMSRWMAFDRSLSTPA